MEDEGTGELLFERGRDEENDSDIWDDSALIKAYDEAVSVMKAKLSEKTGEEVENKSTKKKKQKQKKKKSRSRNLKWNVGDLCRAVYSEDGTVYEAEIISINEATNTCMVRYLGYDNEEEQAFSELLPYKSRIKMAKSASDIEQSDSGMEWKGQSPATSRGPSSIATEGKHHHHHHHHNRLNGAVEPPPFTFPVMPPPPFPFPGLGPSWFPPGSGAHSGPSHSPRIPLVPPPPPPFDESLDGENEALCSMLIAWYMSGYHTGYYQGLQEAQKKGMGLKAESFVNR
ncbi:hypothetical protein ACJMK2_043191 [Sinanodonta woodiana]|uniref:Tudor domain-containing protein n=1 Tax=Sinanodonta woodiana TaxID=1069815 RepID=A0ABD3VW69_SINWO